MKRRREVSVFGLSFLDVMFCGFGSVILLVMIINSDTLARREAVQQDLRGEVRRLEAEARTGRDFLADLRNALTDVEQAEANAAGREREVLADIERTRVELAAIGRSTAAQREHVNRLQDDLKRADADQRRQASEREEAERRGRSVRRFVGEGDRQYLTGLKVGGRRILILVDASASMLDETIVNIIRLRNMPEQARRGAEKWQRTLHTVEWLLSQLPEDSEFQVVTFNFEASALLDRGRWLAARDAASLDRVVATLNRLAPAGGTSLYRAFEEVGALTPRPDNLILLTDGLPTIGKSGRTGAPATGKQRLAYFRQAVEVLPQGVPVNAILFPIEGDPFAASEYWKLAVETGGSFMSPSRDWP